MSEFLQRLENVVLRRRLISRGQKILVAISGGADSMVLLEALHSLAQRNRWKLSVAHFNHQLRGRASDADEKLVRTTAVKLSLPFFSESGEVAEFARHSKISVEMAARTLRHDFLARVARQQKIPVVALAHHADDQVELFFLRLLRGAGGDGLAGMKWRSLSPADPEITLIRPLLGFTKAELLEFIREAKIRFREDATNFSTDFLRNRIRNELLPLLQKNYQPGLSKAVLRLMEIVGAEAEFAAEAAGSWERRHPAGGKRGIKTTRAGRMPAFPEMAFDQLPVAVQRRVLQSQLNQLGITSDFELVEQLRQSPGKFVSAGTDIAVVRTAAGKLSCREHHDEKFKAGDLKLKLEGRAGRVEFGGRSFSWRQEVAPKARGWRRPGSRGKSPHQTEFFDAASIGDGIILRHWRAGDRFQPIGLKTPVKLQDLFVNAKIPAARRRELVLATTKTGDIFWVEGLRIGEKAKLTARTKARLAWNWSKKQV